MKVRNGFVSNSSSSSFLIYGICADSTIHSDDLTEISKSILTNKIGEFAQELESNKWRAKSIISEHLISDGSKLNTYMPYEGILYIGRSFDSIDDDETGKEFRECVESHLKNIFTEDFLNKCDGFDTYQEAWFD